MDYGKLCKEILDLDPKIHFAGVCDDTGMAANVKV
jgi:hypothetical protein